MESLKNYEDIHDASSKLLAWCSHTNNNIKVVDLDGKQEEYANFEGAQLNYKGNKRYRAILNPSCANYSRVCTYLDTSERDYRHEITRLSTPLLP